MFHEEHFAVVDCMGFVTVWVFGVPSSLHRLPFWLLLLKPPSPFLLWIAGQRLPT